MAHRLFAVAAVVVSVVLARPASAPAAGPAAVPVPTLAWASCPTAAAGAASTAGFTCATAEVPVDHADPTRGTVSLAVIKAPARDPARRIGTLFWNPGGPGDSGTAYLPAALAGFPPAVRDRFDIISWDPRGMGGRTTPVVQCFAGAAEEESFLGRMMQGGFPVTRDRLARDAADRTALNAACVGRNGDLLSHVSTADNARDLDLLRRAVGEETLSYYGTSYGTVLGATYLNMFPDRVRSAVLDGAAAAPEWFGADGSGADQSTFIRLGSDFAAATTIDSFMTACGSVAAAGCAFSAGSPEATRQKWTELLRRAEHGIALDGDTIDRPSLLSYVGSSIYVVDPVPGFGRFPGWVAVAVFLEQLWTQSEGPAGKPAEQSVGGAGPSRAAADGTPGPYVTSVGRQLAVICGESANPSTEAAAVRQAEASYARAGVSPWPFVAYCVGWTAKAKDPYTGPWDRSSVAVLVVGNTYDPATALSSSVRMAQALGTARLLIVNGYGHTVLLNPSRCASDHIAAYLIEGKLPPTGVACSQDKAPFPGG